jgi:hypothetical protein
MSYKTAERSKCMWVLFLILLAMGAFGCVSPKSETDLDVTPDGSASGGEGGASSSDKVVLPGGFEPDIRCGDLGKSCSANVKCAGTLACAGGNCMPKIDNEKVFDCGKSSCPADAPICTLGICLTTDQLACVCFQPAAQPVFANCKSLSKENAPECIVEDGLCDGSPGDCCSGLSCLQGKDATGTQQLGLCKKPCTAQAECAAYECCAEADGIPSTFCGPRALCIKACRPLDGECDGEFKPCCEGLICSSSPQDLPLHGCKLPCDQDSDCETRCCVLFTGRDYGICAPTDRCPTP